jgi:ribosomal RNA-processing protein 12
MEEPESGGVSNSGNGTVVDEIYARHRHSKQPTSQQLCAILDSVTEVLNGQAMKPTPTALFAAVMSSIEQSKAQASPEVSPWR